MKSIPILFIICSCTWLWTFYFSAAEMVRVLKNHTIKMNDIALLFYMEKIDSEAAIFYLEEEGIRVHH